MDIWTLLILFLLCALYSYRHSFPNGLLDTFVKHYRGSELAMSSRSCFACKYKRFRRKHSPAPCRTSSGQRVCN
ncbi:hypothetical protein F5J12DRAFT_851303 [Pisolithus orientalis]|uniref:uncharacterized protein n=1 Tax=Pisolithus orientalis TaxID=936130 RepID=UPI002224D558|nr:uncharacterized protein F5J12DRAFT_851303 [Pisolithus orientalis]KAI5997690.1 hypothetical protein F5J12DRAFT_851303 [Pisolithus orientalis]